jgi:hypothetical protein
MFGSQRELAGVARTVKLNAAGSTGNAGSSFRFMGASPFIVVATEAFGFA